MPRPRTDGRTHGQPETNLPRQLLRSWGHNKMIYIYIYIYICIYICSRNQLCQKGIFVHFCTFGLYQVIYKGSNKLPASCFPCIASGYAFYTLTNHLPAFLNISFRQRMCFKVEL